ncbi:MAG: hypothetical protein O9341_06925 [Paucibacter sp.]|nr:hypothetical protein [Roseateles sp.]
MRAFSMLADRQGGLDWAGLPLVSSWLGVQDLDGLMHRLNIIKLYQRPQADPSGNPTHA